MRDLNHDAHFSGESIWGDEAVAVEEVTNCDTLEAHSNAASRAMNR